MIVPISINFGVKFSSKAMIGSSIIHLDQVDSTNNYAAKQLLTKSLNEGTVFVAACQHSGRGQGLSHWESADGLNLTFSIVLFPIRIEIFRQFSISQAVSLGISDFLSTEVEGVSIKWPNDIYVKDKKIAGILIETAISGGKFTRAIVGIGLNVNQEKFVSDAPNPVSLKNLTGKNYDLMELLAGLCAKIDKRYQSLIRFGQDALHREYADLLYKKDSWASYEAEQNVFDGKISGVERDGKLLIETREGEVKGFYFREVGFGKGSD